MWFGVAISVVSIVYGQNAKTNRQSYNAYAHLFICNTWSKWVQSLASHTQNFHQLSCLYFLVVKRGRGKKFTIV